MAKVKKYKLDADDTISFDMIGICSHHSDYRLVWGINTSLNIKLEKLHEDYKVYSKKGDLVSTHPQYFYYDDNDRLEYYFVKNKSGGLFLIPEKPTIDYFLFLNENIAYELDEFTSRLREVGSILGVYKFDPQDIASAENIEFN